MKDNINFSIIFPVMNQADHIERIIKSYHRALNKLGRSFELIAVINGTTDDSYKICKKLAVEIPNLSAYELKESGYGLGILYGIKKARGKYFCYVNSARTYSDELILCLQYFLVNPNVIIHGIRKKRDLWYRKIGSLIFNNGCRLLTGVNSSDINGIPKVISRENYQKLELTSKDSMIDLELIEKAKKMGIPIIEIPIFKNIRHGGRSTSTYKTIFRLLKEMIFYKLRQ